MRAIVTVSTTLLDAAGNEFLSVSTRTERSYGDNPRFNSDFVRNALSMAIIENRRRICGALEAPAE